MAHLSTYREAHPLPFVITHWINLVCMFLLIFTGFMIHYPFLPNIEVLCVGFHITLGFVIFANCLFRVVAAFFMRSSPTGGTRQTARDYKAWLPQADNRHQALPWIRYYLFLKKDKPLGAKYGVPQKISYVLIPIILFFMFWTGLCLWTPTSYLAPMAWSLDLVGGVMVMRMIHYCGMFVLIMFILIHVFLAFFEDPEILPLMFFRREGGGLVYDPGIHNIVGHDSDPSHDEEEARKDARGRVTTNQM